MRSSTWYGRNASPRAAGWTHKSLDRGAGEDHRKVVGGTRTDQRGMLRRIIENNRRGDLAYSYRAWQDYQTNRKKLSGYYRRAYWLKKIEAAKSQPAVTE